MSNPQPASRGRRRPAPRPRTLALAAAMAAALSAAMTATPAAAANRYWTFIGGCTSADWLLMTGGTNSQGQLTCWSAAPGGQSGQAAPGAGDDVYINAPLATTPLLVNFAAPGRPAFTGAARDLSMFGSPSFEAGLALDRYALGVRNMTLGLASSALLGRMDQSGGTVTVSNELTVLGGGYNLSGGLLNAGAVNVLSQLAAARFTHSGGTLIASGISVGSTAGAAASFSQLAGVVTNGALAIGVGTPGSGSGNVSLSGASTRWTNTGDAAVGVVGQGRLTVDGGAQFTGTTATLGLAAGADGRVMVSGNGSQWNLGGLLTVGQAGTGRLDVNQGGKLTAASLVLNSAPVASGTDPAVALRLDGSGTAATLGSALVLGRLRGAALEIADGATLQSPLATVGEAVTTVSLVTLAGTGTDWNTTTGLVIGSAGQGSVKVGAGGSLRSAAATLGAQAAGKGFVLIDGPGARWQSQGSLTLGDAGDGEVLMTKATGAGARLDSQGMVLGLQASGSGVLTMVSGILQNTGEMRLGDAGDGRVVISQAAKLGTDTLNMGYGPGSFGRLSVGSPTSWLDVGQQLTVGLEGAAYFEVGSRGLATSSGAVLGSKLGSRGEALVDASGTAWRNSDGLAVGQYGTGLLTVGNAALVTSGNVVLGQYATGVGTVTLQTGGLLQVTGNLDVGLGGKGQLSLSSQGVAEVSGLTTVAAGSRILLDGGTLRSSRVALGDPALLDWRAGRLQVTGSGGAALDGRTLPTQVDLLPNRALQVDQTLVLGPGSQLLLSGGELTAGRLQLDNALLASTGGGVYKLDMGRIGLLTGQGQVVAGIAGGGAANRIAATGPLTLGLAGRSDGFDFGGTLDLGHQQVVLLDRDLAELGVQTSLGDGAQLVSVNGARLAAGDRLQADGSTSVQGRFVNNGAVVGNTGLLSFIDDVSGAGQFAGSVRFLAGYAPGNSTARVSFYQGRVSFGPQSRLTMEINGTSSGSGYDQLSDIGDLSFEGRLLLAFGPGFSAAAGTRLTLLDFATFQGHLDAAQVDVTGYDRAGLDLSRLPLDGSITVTAVPEPATWAMWLSGAGVFGLRFRRAQRARQGRLLR